LVGWHDVQKKSPKTFNVPVFVGLDYHTQTSDQQVRGGGAKVGNRPIVKPAVHVMNGLANAALFR
jgi:hypothetical protein